MKKKSLIVITLVLFSSIIWAQVAINTDGSLPNTNSILHLKGNSLNKNVIFELSDGGRFGLGTTSPASMLHVYDSTDVSSFLLEGKSDGYSCSKIEMKDYQSKKSWLIVNREDPMGMVQGLGFYFNNGNKVNDYMFINEIGNVGIGTELPMEKLDVDGIISINNQQLIYYADALDGFTGTLIIGNGGNLLNHNSSSDAYYNTYIGVDAGLKCSRGFNNTALGYQSLKMLDLGAGNTAVGYISLNSNSSGNNNCAFGSYSLKTNKNGAANTAMGVASMLSNYNGEANVAIGFHAMYDNISGNDNVAIGTSSLSGNESGNGNVAIGTGALSSGSNTASYNVAVGRATLSNNSIGENNTAIGSGAAYMNTIGEENTSVGSMSMRENDIGYRNTAFGYKSLYNGTGSENTSLSAYSLLDLTSGNNNTAIGYNTGRGIETGDNNTIIGAAVTGLDSDLSNNVIIADGEGHQRIRILQNGNLGINTTSPTATLSVNGSANKPGGGTWAVYSDKRSKENIFPYQKGLQELLQLNPVSFNYKEEFKWGSDTYIGLIAQEVENILPSMVNSKEINGISDFKELDPNELIYLLINSIKEQEKRIADLEIVVQTLTK